MAANSPRVQLPLPFVNQPAYDSPFIAAGSNAEALAWLDRIEDWPAGRLALWGEAGCGKTHLLRAWAAKADGRYLSEAGALPEDPLGCDIAIDNADLFLQDELRLLHFLNAAAEARRSVLLSSRRPPARWPATLPDLQSRLRAMTAVEVRTADDKLLGLLLARLLADRQLAVPKALQSWLLLHLPRTPAAMREAVQRLDAASFATGGAVTRSLAQEVVTAMTPQP